MVDAKIQQLVNQLGAVDQPGRAEEDDVCWEFKDAYVPNHPLVTAFLRSKQRVFVYANFNGKQHARNWARKHCYEIHGSLELGGQGHKAFCRIEKIPNRRLREVFNFSLIRLPDGAFQVSLVGSNQETES